jgi:adenosine kinase
MQIAITGSIAYDYIMKYPGTFEEMLIAESLQHISVSFLVDDMTRHRGGTGANIAYSLGLLGEKPLLVATAGQDFTTYREALETAGVDTSTTVVYDDVFTASFFVTTDQANNQIASFYTGAMSRARDLSLNGSTRPDLVVVSANDPEAMRKHIAECKAEGIPYMYDPGQQVARVPGDVLAEDVNGAHILIVNEYEYAALCKKTSMRHDDLMAVTDIVIVTRGINGADIYTPEETFHIPVYPTDDIKDPTGVGDAFRAGLLKGITAGWSWGLSGRIGALAAAYTLEHIGPQDHSWTPAAFVARFREHFDDEGALDTFAEG